MTAPHPGAPPKLTRRDFLRLSGAAATVGALGGCAGFRTGQQEPSGGGTGSGASGGGRITFTTWAGTAELPAFKRLAEEFRTRTGTTVEIRNVPFAEALTNVDAGLAANDPTDVFRVTYNDVGAYAQRNVLLDLGPSLPAGYRDAFLPGLWRAVSDGDKVYGVPHHTDTTMLLFNRAVLAKAGVTDVPTTYDEAWTWEEFLTVARQVKERGGTQYAFGVNWQQAGAYRWMNFLSQAGGRLLAPDRTSPAVPSPEGEEALRFTQGFFTEGLVPPNTSTKGAYVSELFPNGRTMGMVFAGDFLLPDFEERVAGKFEYGATFAPRQKQAAVDLGGNALVATQGGRNRDAAAKFCLFMAEEAPMRAFCEAATVLPTRTSLSQASLDFKVRPDLMPLYVKQAQAITPELVEQVTVPGFNAVNNVLVEQLERAFVQRQDPGRTLENMASGITRALR